MGNLRPRTSECLTQKTAKRNARGAKSHLCAFQNELEWRGARVSHGVGSLYWRAGVVGAVVAAAAVVSQKVEAKRAGASSRHCRWKPDGRPLKAKPNRRESV